MANNIITEPASSSPATGDWQELIAKDTKTAGGSIGTARLTNWDDTAEPQVAAGSRFEVNGSYYEVTANEDITGWSGISDGATAYVYATPGAGVVAFSYSSTAPTWDSAKGGWFNGTARALFRLTRTNSTTWSNKRRMDVFAGLAGDWITALADALGTGWAAAMAAAYYGKGREIFTSSGDFIVPQGITSVRITGCAAGGNGDDPADTGVIGGGGGGGGEVVLGKEFAVTPGETISITIGAVGADTVVGSLLTLNHGADAVDDAGGAGGSLSDGSFAGGAGGAGGAGESAGAAGTTAAGSFGGTGGASAGSRGGGGGGGGGSLGNLGGIFSAATAGQAGSEAGGAAGLIGGGGGGGGGSYNTKAGDGGDGGFGGGGGGGGNNYEAAGSEGAGGAGGPAIIIVEW